MKLGQLIEYKLCEKWGREASSDLFLFLKELNIWDKRKSSTA